MPSPRTPDPASPSASGIWRQPQRGAPEAVQRAERLDGRRQLLPPAWLSWGVALAVLLGAAVLVLSTLLHLTREMLDLGHHRSTAGVLDR